MTEVFDVNCRRCPRLAAFLDEIRDKHPDYYCRPVPPFGDRNARLLIAGLAPGMHGANRTGRPFTGDYAGVLLFETLHKFGFSTAPESVSADDPLELLDCRISNAVKCLPPDNKPVGAEINTCNTFIASELAALPDDAIVIALGGIAHRAVIKAVGGRQVAYKFGHLAEHDVLGRFTMLDSYHCSRYNTNTGRLTPAMFEQVFSRARQLLDH
ncbi:MAG: uracil-DNA glycosylase [Gammaproteobacteria bacterium]|nr:uracil-DNA glycosylase [Gammaproteobacteria bacterium]